MREHTCAIYLSNNQLKTKIMKKLFTLLLLFMPYCMMADSILVVRPSADGKHLERLITKDYPQTRASSTTFKVNVGNIDMTFTTTSSNEVACGGNNGQCINEDDTSSVVIPEKVTYNGKTYKVTSIGWGAFRSCDINALTLPSTLKKIERYSIVFCRRLKSLNIPASVIEMPEGAVYQNYNVETLTVEAGNTKFVSVDNVIFTKDKKKLMFYATDKRDSSYVIPNTVTRIADYAFDDCDYLRHVTIPSSVKEIGFWGFYQCYNLTNVEIPASVIKIEEGAFTGSNRKLTYIHVAKDNPVYESVNGVVYTKNGHYVISYPVASPTTEYGIIEGTDSIYGHAFADADNLKTVVIPNTVSYIGSCAFYGCYRLESMDIPSSVTHISSQAFDYCSNLTSVYFHSLEPPTTPWFIFGGNEHLKIYVPYQSISKYMMNTKLGIAHIDPAIDWHDNHWTWVLTCIVGIDFTQTPGLKAYKVVKSSTTSAAKDERISLTKEKGSPIKLVQVDKAGAGDCVILKVDDTAAKTYPLTTDSNAVKLTDNLLVGVIDTTNVSSKNGSKVNYAFDGKDFVRVNGTESVEGGMGYLQLPEDVAAEVGTTVNVEKLVSEVTGINGIRMAEQQKSAIYNMQGQKANGKTPGIYIVNGKNYVLTR